MRSFFDGAPEISKNVPMLMGSVSEEGKLHALAGRPRRSGWRPLTRSYGEAKAQPWRRRSRRRTRGRAFAPVLYVHGGGLNGLGMRNNVTRMATMKHDQKAAPVFAWYFTWQSPMLEDAGAWHTAELAFLLRQHARCAQGTGKRAAGAALARKMATAWASFRAHGQSQPAGLAWAPFDPARCPTMIFDGVCRMVDDSRG